MSVIVKGMEMPDSCYHCKIAESCGHYIANYTDRRHPDCPLIALPDKHGKWIYLDKDKRFFIRTLLNVLYAITPLICMGVNAGRGDANFCPNCGADMRTPVEIARNIVHKVIDNSVWADSVDTAKMHKVVDDKYAEIRGNANVDANT